MRSPLWHPKTKNTSCISLLLLLLTIITVIGISKPVKADTLAIMSLDPPVLEVSAPGQNFTINLNITGVTLMQGYEFKLGFNTTVLNATAVTTSPLNPPGTILGPLDPVTYQWVPLQNASDGFVFAQAVLPFGQAFTGSGTFMTINFTALAMGNSTLDLYETVLGDASGQPIDHTAVDGLVTVIPEFPTFLIIPLLMIATLAATFLAKVQSRKRKDAIMLQ